MAQVRQDVNVIRQVPHRRYARGDVQRPLRFEEVRVHVPEAGQYALTRGVYHLGPAGNLKPRGRPDGVDPTAGSDNRVVPVHGAMLGVEDVCSADHPAGTEAPGQSAGHLFRPDRRRPLLRFEEQRSDLLPAFEDQGAPSRNLGEELAILVEPNAEGLQAEPIDFIARDLPRLSTGSNLELVSFLDPRFS